jgi:hypothetical protein
MTRSLALLAGALLAAALPAADPPKEKTESAAVVVVHARVKDNLLEWYELQKTPHVQAKQVTETVDGKKVTKTVNEIAYATGVAQRAKALKDVKATDAQGKAVSADDLGKRFKDGGVAVVVSGKVSDELRKAFAADAIFLDEAAK